MRFLPLGVTFYFLVNLSLFDFFFLLLILKSTLYAVCLWVHKHAQRFTVLYTVVTTDHQQVLKLIEINGLRKHT